MNLQNSIESGVHISSSGTTGIPKTIFRSPENIKKCNHTAVIAQEISKDSSIYTVTRMSHAGGLLAQTLPAISVGAKVKVEPLNPYNFLKEFQNHTHTFLPPSMMKAIMRTKSFANYDFSGKRVLTGSEPICYDTITAYVERGAIVQPNWGMSEIGPIAILATFKNSEDIEKARATAPNDAPILGDTFFVDYKIVDDELYVRSEMCIYDDWFATGDIVAENAGRLYYLGRKGAKV